MHFEKFQKPVPIIKRSMFPCSCPTFSYQYSQKILLTNQLDGTINQVVKSFKSGLYGQRQTSWHLESPKQPEAIIEIFCVYRAKVSVNNDPSLGSPTETLLRILLPLSATARSSFHQWGSVHRQESRSRTSLKHSNGCIWLTASWRASKFLPLSHILEPQSVRHPSKFPVNVS
jgi:hypothetical protein